MNQESSAAKLSQEDPVDGTGFVPTTNPDKDRSRASPSTRKERGEIARRHAAKATIPRPGSLRGRGATVALREKDETDG